MTTTGALPLKGTNQTARPNMMRAARLHKPGQPLSIDFVQRPVPRPTEVIVKVAACGVVPNMINVLNNMANWPDLHQPSLPAIYGLDVSGTIVEKGSLVHGLSVGDRVYVNPGRYCGSCRSCRTGNTTACNYFMLNGYFGAGELSQQLYDDYPYGGFAEYMCAPQYSIVQIPDNLSFETAARWGYLGTGYAALRRGGADMNSVVLVDGISGTLGLGVALFALALGVPKVLGLGRNVQLLERVKSLAPDRIHVHRPESAEDVRDWARSLTNGDGVDVIIDALPTGAAPEAFLTAFAALSRGGRVVNIGSVLGAVGIDLLKLNNNGQTVIGSLWFTTKHGEEMAKLAESNSVNLDVFEHQVFPLEEINSVLSGFGSRHGGFTNYVITPNSPKKA